MSDDPKDMQCPLQLGSTEFRRDLYGSFAKLREESPVSVIEANGFRMWMIGRYDDAVRILKDSSLLKDVVEHRRQLAIQCVLRPEKRARVPHASRRSLLDRDGADHRRLRSLLKGTFSLSMVERHRPQAEKLSAELLHALPTEAPVDLVTQFARPLCMTLVAEFYGVPLDEALAFPNWENVMLTGTSIEEIEDGGRKCYEFALRMIDLKRRAPGDDLFTRLLRSHEEEKKLDVDELASTFIVLMVGAGEPSNAIANGLLLLLSNPGSLAAIKADPGLASDFVEEILRCESPFRLLPPRFSNQPIELDDVTIPAGEMITVSPAAANRDPLRFPHPEKFEPTEFSKDHLAFGQGAHTCLGSQLARMEIEVAIRSFVQHCSEYRLELAKKPRWRPGDFMRRLDQLTVTLCSPNSSQACEP